MYRMTWKIRYSGSDSGYRLRPFAKDRRAIATEINERWRGENGVAAAL
jgi:hypothetical protein